MQVAKQSYQGKVKSGRITILVIAVLFTLGIPLVYVLMTNEIQ